ncbi:MAG: ATP-binding protein [Candidatus Thiothrix sulfatifontis]|nr:MAG: ATP-binding protein [Candidatus Thiothrix sulfatifontis]
MNRLFWKILLTFWLALLLLFGVVGIPLLVQQWQLHTLEETTVVHPMSIVAVKAAALTLQHGGTAALTAMLREQDQEAPADMQIYALDNANQELLGRTVAPTVVARLRAATPLNLSFPVMREVDHDGNTYLLFAPWSGQFPEFANAHRLRMNKKHTADVLVIFSIFAASFLSSWGLAWYFSHPVKLLNKAFQTVAAGDLTRRVAQDIGSRRDELADLGKGFDHMTTQLQSLVETQQHLMASQQRLLHDISHELRSPLTRLNMSIALARQQPAYLNKSLKQIEQEAERLECLVNEVLTLARLEAGISTDMDSFVDIRLLLQTLIETVEFEALALQRHIQFIHDLPDEGYLIPGNAELLYRALENLLRNAIQHTPPTGTVLLRVSGYALPKALQIGVEDQGNGVSETELTSIFKPFYRRNTPANNNSHEGYGLGLAIAYRAISAHQGSIIAKNREEGGLVVQITLPC